MSMDASLFGDGLFGDAEPQPAPVADRTPAQIADWQVDLLRKALDTRGLTAMADRQQAVEGALGRSVESLRSLTSEEAIQVLNQLGASPAARPAQSTWDERDEDTWIDRL